MRKELGIISTSGTFPWSFVKLYIDEQHGSHPFFIYFIRRNIDLNEQEGKPNCKDINIKQQKCLCLQSNPENVSLLRRG
jgi:hypothetical protein